MKTDSHQNLTHVQDGDLHAVATALRVLITRADAGGFVAQGLDIDYVATGDTVEEVQDHFAQGLLGTVRALLRRSRPLSALFKSSAPPEAWQSYMDSDRQDMLACATFVDLRAKLPPKTGFPFDRLAYCQIPEASLA